LVIGNDSYSQVSKLENARADATAIARALERSGFKVTLRTDIDFSAFKVALRAFKADLRSGDEAIFYFSGHGVELGGTNYLLPIDVKGDSEDQVRDDSVPLQRVLEDLQERKARFALAIVDACRNNPFRSGGRSIGGRGLAPTTAATGQMVFYSAGSGQQALDQLGPKDPVRNGVFTRVLLKEMEKPGVPVSDVLRNVREEVAALAKSVGKEQVPAIYDQSLGRFYFTESRANQASLPTAPTSSPTRPDETVIDFAFWDAIKTSTQLRDYESYLRQFPQGRFAALAESRRDQLMAARPTTQPVPVVAAPGGSQPRKDTNISNGNPTMGPLPTTEPVRGRKYFAKNGEFAIEVEANEGSLKVEMLLVATGGSITEYRCGVFSSSLPMTARLEVRDTQCSPFSGPVAIMPNISLSGVFPVLSVRSWHGHGSHSHQLSEPKLYFIDSAYRPKFDVAAGVASSLTTEQFSRARD
jgi:hypothetical protein